MCLPTSYSLVSYLDANARTLTHMQKKTSKKYPVCSNRQGQQVVNVNQYPEQKPLSLSFQLSEWKRYANCWAQRADGFRLRFASASKGDKHKQQHGRTRHKQTRKAQESVAAQLPCTAESHHGRTDGRTGPPRSEASPAPLALTTDEDNYAALLPGISKTHFAEWRKEAWVHL